jgi:hypothetical protein
VRRLLYDLWGLVPSDIRVVKTDYSKIYIMDNKYVLKKSYVNTKDQQEVINDCLHNISFDTPVCKAITNYRGDFSLYPYTLYKFSGYNAKKFTSKMICESAKALGKLHHSLFVPTRTRLKIISVIGDVYPDDTRELTYYNKEMKFVIEQIKNSYSYISSNFQHLPMQIGHFDFNKSNLLFEGEKLSGIIDFDLMRYSEKARDFSIAIHKICDTTKERQLFLDTYTRYNELSAEEFSSLDDLYFDEIRRKLIYTIKRYYFSQKAFATIYNIFKDLYKGL